MARRHSLLARLLAMSVVVAGCSIGATAWLAAQSTSGAINQEIGESLATDATIYDALLGYAAGHPQWSGVQDVVTELSERTGRRITLTTQARVPIADSGDPQDTPLPRTPSAVVDPLAVDPVLKPGAAIDPRAVGPYQLTAAERAKLAADAQNQLRCLRRSGSDGRIVELPNGRSTVEIIAAEPQQKRSRPVAVPDDPPRAVPAEVPMPETSAPVTPPLASCGAPTTTTETERTANAELLELANACLTRQGADPLPAEAAETTWPNGLRAAPEDQRCVDAARREQLGAYVSPAAQLFITRPGTDQAATDLSTVGISRIAWTALVVLVLTVGMTALAASRLVRPIDAITAAARRMGGGDRSARVRTSARGEIGELAAAFNAMSEQVERTEQQRKTMVSDIAHELRTPLVNVRGWLEAAQDGVATLDQPLVASLLEETLLLQHLIDDLQDLALADAGKLRAHLEPVHLGAILEQVAAAHRGRAEAGGIELRASAEGDPDLAADPTRLRQALGNLVSNALRHTPAGGLVELRARRVADEVIIEVSDTGVGIPAESLPHVFDRFWRAEKSRGRHGGGSGLGLAITHHLVQAHGGSIEVRSTVGAGTTFTIRLPAMRSSVDSPGQITGR
ncbi:two-component system, OmpR family, sensor histidine kinase BaeS [Saccharopolyspora antimicrobica]|uniref:histidine kinase n=1 Tax=Saccharopolyspora antimicrobica TaxID=455193 RepID=A0A1I4QTA5_9PSEU|nr:ATP-binding protein [Saccharopolyspora antimicrobica]RKT88316.1 two-component system sensor histidine kinase BaeS [Saccharopolyspora antimicrobica]SFM42943.1 two-component system, OmpR family, sensor histidine kinase BaeS [Saccharopolyspora antimicrobica]